MWHKILIILFFFLAIGAQTTVNAEILKVTISEQCLKELNKHYAEVRISLENFSKEEGISFRYDKKNSFPYEIPANTKKVNVLLASRNNFMTYALDGKGVKSGMWNSLDVPQTKQITLDSCREAVVDDPY